MLKQIIIKQELSGKENITLLNNIEALSSLQFILTYLYYILNNKNYSYILNHHIYIFTRKN